MTTCHYYLEQHEIQTRNFLDIRKRNFNTNWSSAIFKHFSIARSSSHFFSQTCLHLPKYTITQVKLYREVARKNIWAVVIKGIRPWLEDTALTSLLHFFPLENWYFCTPNTRWNKMRPHLGFHLQIYSWCTGLLIPFNCVFPPTYNLALKSEFQPPSNFQSTRSLPAGTELQVKFCFPHITHRHKNHFASNFSSLELKVKHRYLWSASEQGMNAQNIDSNKYSASCSNCSGLWPAGQMNAFLPQNPFF